MIEDPADGAMLQSQFGDDGGNLYKPDGPGADWTVFTPEGFAKKTNEKAADFSDVAGAVAALHAPQDDPAVWRENLEARFDVDGFLRWLAVNTVIANWDAYGRMPHNYYLYGDPGDGGRLKWIPWDHNMSFARADAGIAVVRRASFPTPGGAIGNGAPAAGIETVIRSIGLPGSDEILHSQAGEGWPLIGRLMADEVYAARYRELLEHALGGLAEPAAFEARARELHSMISVYAVGAQGERPTHTTLPSPNAFFQSIDGPGGLLQQLRNRRAQVLAALEGV